MCTEHTASYKSLCASWGDQTWSRAISQEFPKLIPGWKRQEKGEEELYQPLDAELCKTKAKAMEPIRSQVEPIVDLIAFLSFRVFLPCSYSWLSLQGAQRRPRKTRSAGQRADVAVNWSDRSCSAVCLKEQNPKHFLRLLWGLRRFKEAREKGREGSFSAWLTGDAFKSRVVFNGKV